MFDFLRKINGKKKCKRCNKFKSLTHVLRHYSNNFTYTEEEKVCENCWKKFPEK